MKKKVLILLSNIIGLHYQGIYQGLTRIRSDQELEDLRENYLRSLLLHAYHNVFYYKIIFDKIELVKNGEVDLSKFNEIPILTKEIIRNQRKELVANDYHNRRWYYNSSGGSTGEPVRFIQDDRYAKWGRATATYWYKNILGIDELGMKKIFLWGSERDLFGTGVGWRVKINNWLNNTIILNSFKMSPEDMKRHIKTINSYKPALLRGYASSLHELCRYASGEGIKLHSPKAIISSADTLTYEMRENIERSFGSRVFDFYGSRESNNLAGECKEGLMHILAFHNHVEVLDKGDRSVNKGEEGRVIVTNLHNYSMPLIRYDVGDTAILGPRKCKCGNVLPTLYKITGRSRDHFISKNGTIVSPHILSTLFFRRDWVKGFQVIQEEYDRVRIMVVLERTISQLEKEEIEEKLAFILGQDCKIIWEFVDSIPKTPQGKYRYIISRVPR